MRLLQVENAVGLLFLLGGAWVLFRGDSRLRVGLCPILLAAVVVGTWRYASIHYLLWTFPPLAIAAAICLADLGRRIAPVRTASFIGVVIVLATSGNLLSLTGASASWVRQDSNLLLAERWIEDSIPGGSSVHHNWYGVPTLWTEAVRQRFLKAVEERTDLSLDFADRIRQKPTYEGYLGFQAEPPSSDLLQAESPEWVVVNTTLLPNARDPLPGYRSEELVNLHNRLALYHDYLDNSGRFEVAKRFESGSGDSVILYRRVDSGMSGGAP